MCYTLIVVEQTQDSKLTIFWEVVESKTVFKRMDKHTPGVEEVMVELLKLSKMLKVVGQNTSRRRETF